MPNFKEIFENTKTIALIGCSPDTSKPSNKVASYLLEQGFVVYPVYPKEDTILGQKVYRSLSQIPHQIDMVDIFRKSSVIASVIDEAIQKGNIKYIWTQLGLTNDKACQKAEQNGISTIQDKCTKIEHQILTNQEVQYYTCEIK